MISVKGEDRVIKAFRVAGVKYRNLMVKAVNMAALDVQNHALAGHEKGLGHAIGRWETATGNLMGQIRATEARVKGTKIIATVVAGTEYAEDLEFGTKGGRKAWPFMDPAYVANQGSIEKRFRELILANGLR